MGGGSGRWVSPRGCLPWQWAGVLSRLALEQERILNPVLDRVRTADHHQLRSLTGLIRNLSRHARNKDEMCECRGGGAQWAPTTLFLLGLASSYLQPRLSALLPAAPLPAAACTKAGPSPNSPPRVLLCHHLAWLCSPGPQLSSQGVSAEGPRSQRA